MNDAKVVIPWDRRDFKCIDHIQGIATLASLIPGLQFASVMSRMLTSLSCPNGLCIGLPAGNSRPG
jgi:hypothetical protein